MANEGGWALSRRQFLGTVVAAAVMAACSDDGDGEDSEGAGRSPGRGLVEPPPVDLARPAFTLGVASGDPLSDRVILWTRLAPEPLTGGGVDPDRIDVAWDVATDDRFRDVVQSGRAPATAALGHSLHVDVRGLEPDQAYFYRFRLGNGETSPMGRTRTLPAADSSPEQMRFAVATCSDLQGGHYAAYRHMAEEDLDAVVFLGDYIYEYPGADEGPGDVEARLHPGVTPRTLEEYRDRYALYRTDPNLQAAHRAFPWILTWDDHDVENNYAGDVSVQGTPPAIFEQQRAAAYQAWYEHMPMRIEPPDGPDVRIYHDVGVGDLLRLYVLDERQHGDAPPCRDTSASDAGAGCPERDDPDNTFLGAEQERWLAERLTRSETTWNVLAQQVMMAGLDIGGTAPPAYFLDSWDGHPAARARLLDMMASEEVSNPVVLTGDYHAAFVADLRAEPFEAGSAVVATELVTPAISSALFAEDYTAANPHIGYFAARHGYLVCTAERERWTAAFRYVSDVADPDATIETGATFVIEAGSPGARPA